MTLKEIYTAYQQMNNSLKLLGFEEKTIKFFEDYRTKCEAKTYKEFIKFAKKQWIPEFYEIVLNAEFIRMEYGFENKEYKLLVEIF